MDPVNPWTPSTMDTHMSRRLGVDSAGIPCLRPTPKGVEQYAVSDEITCDYANFEHLAERGLPQGAAGVLDLEAGLRLVRGKPFGGAVAHTIAFQRIQDEVLDIDTARRAIGTGLDVEPAAEVLYRARDRRRRAAPRSGHRPPASTACSSSPAAAAGRLAGGGRCSAT
ncbi:hypothetical protein ACFVH7_19660 [Kitasatospora indigofera]|uniref:hypothetical protein n=1 Tax=Kitasatospora indigofera TaxID=67307 RepID=UPI0036453DA3